MLYCIAFNVYDIQLFVYITLPVERWVALSDRNGKEQWRIRFVLWADFQVADPNGIPPFQHELYPWRIVPYLSIYQEFDFVLFEDLIQGS